MKKNILLVFVCIALQSIYSVKAQNCPTDLLSGQNLIVNGDFSDGFNNWQTDYNQFTSGFSTPGFLYVGTGSQMSYFNSAFSTPFNGQTGVGTDKFLMIDGVCTPGVKIWKQSNIPIQPNTNYYFSFWINSLKDNPNFPGIVNLDVNGTNIGSNISAPLVGGGNPSSPWKKYETVWNSGLTPPATITISIEGNQTIGCSGNGGESDFAIDNISFIPGCQYGSAGPQPKLGPDQTLCGFGLAGLVLNANVPINATTTITWNDGTTGLGLLAPYTKIVTAPGTYSVCVTDNGSCTKSDIIVITNSFSIDLGPDVVLCDPASITLDAKFVGIGVTYKWYKDGAVAEGTNSNKTYFVNTPGIYKVIVTDPLCGPQEDEITITTKAPKVTNQTYCNAGDITLNVTPPNDGKYKWWNSPTSIASADLLQKGGDSYTFTATPPTNYTFYVQDTASFRVTVGLPLTGNGLSGKTNRGEQNENVLTFDVLTAITIDSIYLDLKVYGCGSTVGIEVRTSGGTLVGNATWITTPITGCTTGDQILKMPVNIPVPVGTGYTIKYLEPSGNNTDMYWYEDGMNYPQTYVGSIKFAGPQSPNISGWKPNSIPGMYRWVVTAGTACARVPVQAILNSCLPPVADAGANIPLCNTRTTKLNAGPLESVETGEWELATGSTGSVNPANSPTGTLTFTGDTAYVVWIVTNSLGVDKDTIMVTTTTVNKPKVSGPSETCPSTSGLQFTASPDNSLTGSTYQWTVLSGDLSIISGATTNTITADAGNTKSVVRVTETKNNCSAFKNDTLEISAPTEIAYAGEDQTICSNAYTLMGNTPKIGIGTWTTVTIDPNQVLTPIPPNKATVTNLSDNVTYEFMYQISGTCGNSTDNVKITVNVNGLKISSVTKPNDIACVGTQRALQANVIGSSGPYTYVWNKKGTKMLDSMTVSTYIITTSAVEETYYVYVKNKTCRTDLDSVKITSIDFQKLTVPNLITPNGDGLNDVLKIVEVRDHNTLMLPEKSILKIYNSWGNEVYHADNYNNNWNAEGLSDGVYYYYVKAGCGGEEHKSWIQIIGNTK